MLTPPGAKSPACSRVEATHIVLPADANAIGIAFGGRLMEWIDLTAVVAARRHTEGMVVTAAIDSLRFREPIRTGDIVVLRASVNRVWRSSLEVGVRIDVEPLGSTRAVHAASAYLTFVAVDEQRQPRVIPNVIPEGADEHRRYAAAERRRALRLAANQPETGPHE